MLVSPPAKRSVRVIEFHARRFQRGHVEFRRSHRWESLRHVFCRFYPVLREKLGVNELATRSGVGRLVREEESLL